MWTAGVFGTHAAAAFALGSPEARCTVAVHALVHTRTPVAVRGPCLVTTAAILVAHKAEAIIGCKVCKESKLFCVI